MLSWFFLIHQFLFRVVGFNLFHFADQLLFSCSCCPNLFWFIPLTVWSYYIHWAVQSSLVQCAPGESSAWVCKRSRCSLNLLPSLLWPCDLGSLTCGTPEFKQGPHWLNQPWIISRKGVPHVVLTRFRLCMMQPNKLLWPQWQGTYTHRNQCVFSIVQGPVLL